jgi:hypothetical protein
VKILGAILILIIGYIAAAEARKVTVGVPVLDITQSALFIASAQLSAGSGVAITR